MSRRRLVKLVAGAALAGVVAGVLDVGTRNAFLSPAVILMLLALPGLLVAVVVEGDSLLVRRRLHGIALVPLVGLVALVGGEIAYEKVVFRQLARANGRSTVEVFPFVFEREAQIDEPGVVTSYRVEGGWYLFAVMTDGTVRRYD